MSHVIFRIGPLEQPDGVSAWFVFPGVENRQVFFASDEDTAFRDILGVYNVRELSADSQLAAAAARHGVATRDLTAEQAKQLGVMTFELALPGVFERVRDQAAIHQLATASRFFHEGAAWREPFSDRTIDVAFTGSVQRRMVARILGSKRSAPGIALYTSEEAIEQIVQAFDRGTPAAAATADVLGVTIEDGPVFAADVFRRVYGVPGVPTPLKIEGGAPVPVDEIDLLLLSAALRCIAILGEDEESESEVRIEGAEVSAIAFLRG